jgi:hypothetical protein
MNYFQKISRSNKRFAKMTRLQKRVQLAKDVIAQLDTRFFDATNICYLEIKGIECSNVDLQDALPEAIQCDVCAKGAIFAAAVLRLNDFSSANIDMFGHVNSDDMEDYVQTKKLFTNKQFELLEDVFEHLDGRNFASGLGRNLRLRLLMQNIIVNKGNILPLHVPVLTRLGYKIPGYQNPR